MTRIGIIVITIVLATGVAYLSETSLPFLSKQPSWKDREIAERYSQGLNLKEYAACSEASSSSAWSTQRSAASLAIDGVAPPGGKFPFHDRSGREVWSCTHSAYRYGCSGKNQDTDDFVNMSSPWLLFDLGEAVSVCVVKIWNRGDFTCARRWESCGERLNPFYIVVGNGTSWGDKGNVMCGGRNLSAPSGTSAGFHCGGIVGQRIWIVAPGGCRILTVCEIQIWGLSLQLDEDVKVVHGNRPSCPCFWCVDASKLPLPRLCKDKMGAEAATSKSPGGFTDTANSPVRADLRWVDLSSIVVWLLCVGLAVLILYHASLKY